MDATWRAVLWEQFGGAIEMLENAMLFCPDDLWSDRSRQPEFWYLAFHTLFWLDLYLSGTVEGFAPPPPFTLDELDPDGTLPERPYTKPELAAYLEHVRAKCRVTIQGLDAEAARERRVFPSGEFSGAELLLYNMRHVQHHAAQMNLILRQATGSAPNWVARAQRGPVDG